MKKCLIIILLLLNNFLIAQEIREEININDSISLVFTQASFYPKQHKIVTNSNELIAVIDDYLVFGTDATLPKTELVNIVLIINGKSSILNTKGIYNPNISTIENNSIVIHQTLLGYEIRVLFSNGAGTCGAEWVIDEDNNAFRTIITNKWDVLDQPIIKKNSFLNKEPQGR